MHPSQWGKMHIHPCWDGKAARKKDKATKDLHQLCGDISCLISLLYLTPCRRPDEKKNLWRTMRCNCEGWTPSCSEQVAELLRSWSASGSTCTSPWRSSSRGGTRSSFLTQPHQGKPHVNHLHELLLSPRERLSHASSFLAPMPPTRSCIPLLIAAQHNRLGKWSVLKLPHHQQKQMAIFNLPSWLQERESEVFMRTQLGRAWVVRHRSFRFSDLSPLP